MDAQQCERKQSGFSEVTRGTIEVSVSASGKVVPAFEEIINTPINSRIVEVYGKEETVWR